MDFPSYKGKICTNCGKNEANEGIFAGDNTFYLCDKCPKKLPNGTDVKCHFCKGYLNKGDGFEYSMMKAIVDGELCQYIIMFCSVPCLKSYKANLNNRENTSVLNLGTLCRVCNKLSSKCCCRCKQAYYCSKECQMKDWLEHKKYCGK
jgi:hypothetical protein